MRRSANIRLTLLPLLAGASLAAAQEPPRGFSDPTGASFEASVVATSLEALDADNLEDDDRREGEDALLVVPTARGGFGAYVFSARA